MNTNEIVARSWNDLQDRLFEESWNPQIRRHRSRHVFRGVGDAGFDLSSTLMRLGGNFATLERHLLRNFEKYAVTEEGMRGPARLSFWQLLALAQHHGLPTRLLDWTYSPYVALHFACNELARFDADAVVWKVDFNGVHRLLPPVLKENLSSHGAHVFTVDMLMESLDRLKALDDLNATGGPYAFFFEPPSMNARIVNQYAVFSVLSDPCMPFDAWLRDHPELCQRIIIPGALKWEVRDKLDQSNITERVLFPGLDGLCGWLARQYTPRV